MLTTTTRLLCPADAPMMASLIRALDWGQTADDLVQVMANGPALGTFDAASNELVSMAALPGYDSATTDKDTGFSWLAYVATKAEARKRGLASAKLITLFGGLAPTQPVALYGSLLGAPLYASRFDFVDRGSAHLMCIKSEALASEALAHLQPHAAVDGDLLDGGTLVPASECLPQVAKLDALVYGTDRSAALARWVQSPPPQPACPPASWAILHRDGHATGCIVARPISSSGGVFLGPLIASSGASAEALLRQSLSAIRAWGLEGGVTELLTIQPWEQGKEADASGESASRLLAESLGFEQVAASRLMVMRGDGRAAPAWIDRAAQARRAAPVAASPWPWAAAGFEWG